MKRLMMNIVALFALSSITVFAPFTAGAAPGDLDTSFGGTGVIALASADSQPIVKVQPNGSILLAFSTFDGSASQWVFMQLKPDGTLDGDFGNGGVVTTNPQDLGQSKFSPLYDVSLQADGKIFALSNDGIASVVVRYHSNGALDASYNGDGFVVLFSGIGTSRVRSLAIQEDGALVVGGGVCQGAAPCKNDFGLTRLDAAGGLDSGFNASGIVITDLGGTGDQIERIVIRNGRIVALGYTSNPPTSHTEVTVIAVYKEDGTLDTTFDGDGLLIPNPDPEDPERLSNDDLAVQSDGKILLLGSRKITPPGESFEEEFFLRRFNADGTVDIGFGVNGELIVSRDMGDFRIFHCSRPTVEPSGKILLGCSIVVGDSTLNASILRINTNGAIDTTFGSGGLSQAIDIASDAGESVAAFDIQADGRILVAGLSLNTVFVARYLSGDAPAGTTGGATGSSSGGCSLIR